MDAEYVATLPVLAERPDAGGSFSPVLCTYQDCMKDADTGVCPLRESGVCEEPEQAKSARVWAAYIDGRKVGVPAERAGVVQDCGYCE